MAWYWVFESEIMLLRGQSCQSDREAVRRYFPRGLGVSHRWLPSCREVAERSQGQNAFIRRGCSLRQGSNSHLRDNYYTTVSRRFIYRSRKEPSRSEALSRTQGGTGIGNSALQLNSAGELIVAADFDVESVGRDQNCKN